MNKLRLRILTMLYLFFVCNICSATERDKPKETSSNISIIESITGISAKQNQTLTSLYNEAMEWLKTPYRRGGMSRKGMDCSGLTNTIYQNVFGIKLQRSSRAISEKDITDLAKEELQVGDLVFFATSRKKAVNHVGVYLGNNHFVHASCKKGVIISNLSESYYTRTWVKGGRIKEENDLFNSLFQLDNNEDIYNIKNIATEIKLIKTENLICSVEDKISTPSGVNKPLF